MKTTCKKSWPVNLTSDNISLNSLYFLQLKLFLRFSQMLCCYPFGFVGRLGFLPAKAGSFSYFSLIFIVVTPLLVVGVGNVK